jgi:hypothetical protein
MKRPSISACTSQTSIARPASYPAKDRRRCAGRYTRPPWSPAARARPTASTTCRSPRGSGTNAHAWRSLASCSNAATTRSENSATRRSSPLDPPVVRAHAPRQPMHRGQLPRTRCRHVRVDGPQRPSGRTALPPSGDHTSSPSCRRPTNTPRVVDPDKHGRPRAHQRHSASTAPVSGSRGGCPPRLPQNRTYAGRIRLFGTAGYDPRRRPVCRPRIIPIAPFAA